MQDGSVEVEQPVLVHRIEGELLPDLGVVDAVIFNHLTEVCFGDVFSHFVHHAIQLR